ncbi:aminoglycoside phosphotransferase family protein [Candidatus Daviesbacteria bacterium]|nr:aminoglycoside phosphotransferase family protein [Candidatus Daviesbacteria bacterium]
MGLVDNKYALKFPRNQYAYLRDQYEEQVLLDLKSLNQLLIPKILGKGNNPPYFIASFVPGKHLSADEIRQLSTEQQEDLAEKIARFAYAMHSILPVDQAIEHRSKLKLDSLKGQPWVIYFEESLKKVAFPNPRQDRLAKEYYKRWKSLHYDTPEVVVHDDIHNENLMFEGTNLIGVVDFGDTDIGHPEQEFRQMYRINETILNLVIKNYEQLSNLKLNKEAIILFAILQELAVYSEMLTSTKKDRPSFYRATKNLQKWLPEGNWENDTTPFL